MTNKAAHRDALYDALRVKRGDEKRLRARVAALGLGETCGRCGGCGRHSFNMLDGDRCYGCAGWGTVFPPPARLNALLARAREAVATGRLDAYLEGLRARARSAKAMDRIFAAWKEAFSGPRDYRFMLAAEAAIKREAGQEPTPEEARARRLADANLIAFRAQEVFSRFDRRFQRLSRKNWLAYEKALNRALAEVARARAEAVKIVAGDAGQGDR